MMKKVKGTPDSYIIYNFFEREEDYRDICQKLEEECVFADKVRHNRKQPLAHFQSLSIIEEKEKLYYLRCPSIKAEEIAPFSPTIIKIIEQLEKITGQKCNIAKIVKYGEGSSKQLKSHADKIIDLERGTSINTIRFGDTKSLLLTHKVTQEEILIELPHNTLFVLGWETNKQYRHGVPPSSSTSFSISSTYSVVLRTSVTLLDTETMKLSGSRVTGSNNSPIANEELVKLWSEENNSIVEDTHYDTFCSE